MSEVTVHSVCNKGPVYPMLLYFQNGCVTKDFETNCAVLQDKNQTRMIVMEDSELVYAGEEEKEDSGKTFILARNRISGNTRLIEVGSADLKPLSKTELDYLQHQNEEKEMKLKRTKTKHKANPVHMDTGQIESNMTVKNLVCNKSIINDISIPPIDRDITNEELDFIQQQHEISVSEFEKKQFKHPEKIRNNFETDKKPGQEFVEQVNYTYEFHVPPINRDAKTVEDVYHVEKILSKDEYEKIFLELQENNYVPDLHPYIKSYMKGRHLSPQLTVLAAYTSCLIKLLNVNYIQIRSTKFTICQNSKMLNEIIMTRFTELAMYKVENDLKVENIKPKHMQDKIVCHIIVFMLLLNNFNIYLEPLCIAMHMADSNRGVITRLVRLTGASIKKCNIGRQVVLKLPLVKNKHSFDVPVYGDTVTVQRNGRRLRIRKNALQLVQHYHQQIELVTTNDLISNDLAKNGKPDSNDLHLPFINRDAAHVEDVYLLEKILSEDEYEEIYAELLENNYTAELHPYIQSFIETETLSLRLTVLAIYTSELIKLLHVHKKDMNDDFILCHYSKTLNNIIMRDFQMMRPQKRNDKIICYIIAFTLILSNFSFKMMPLFESIKAVCDYSHIMKLIVLIGASMTYEENEITIQLKLPLAYIQNGEIEHKLDSTHNKIDPHETSLPLVNREASALEDFYCIKEIFSEEEYFQIFFELVETNYMEDLHPYIQQIVGEKTLSLESTVLAVYASELIKFSHDNTFNSQHSKTLDAILLKRFTENKESKISREMANKSVCHLIVCMLILNNFKFQMDSLLDVIKLRKGAKFHKLVSLVGATIECRDDVSMVKLKLPLDPSIQATQPKTYTHKNGIYLNQTDKIDTNDFCLSAIDRETTEFEYVKRSVEPDGDEITIEPDDQLLNSKPSASKINSMQYAVKKGIEKAETDNGNEDLSGNENVKDIEDYLQNIQDNVSETYTEPEDVDEDLSIPINSIILFIDPDVLSTVREPCDSKFDSLQHNVKKGSVEREAEIIDENISKDEIIKNTEDIQVNLHNTQDNISKPSKSKSKYLQRAVKKRSVEPQDVNVKEENISYNENILLNTPDNVMETDNVDEEDLTLSENTRNSEEIGLPHINLKATKLEDVYSLETFLSKDTYKTIECELKNNNFEKYLHPCIQSFVKRNPLSPEFTVLAVCASSLITHVNSPRREIKKTDMTICPSSKTLNNILIKGFTEVVQHKTNNRKITRIIRTAKMTITSQCYIMMCMLLLNNGRFKLQDFCNAMKTKYTRKHLEKVVKLVGAVIVGDKESLVELNLPLLPKKEDNLNKTSNNDTVDQELQDQEDYKNKVGPDADFAESKIDYLQHDDKKGIGETKTKFYKKEGVSDNENIKYTRDDVLNTQDEASEPSETKIDVKKESVELQAENVDKGDLSNTENKKYTDDMYIPPINRNATKLEDVYPIEKFLSKDTYKKIKDELKNCNYKKELHPCIKSFVKRKSPESTVLAVCASSLIKYVNSSTQEYRKKDYMICPYSKTLNNILMKEFTELVKQAKSRISRVKSANMKMKSVCYIMVCLLILNNYHFKLDLLNDALKTCGYKFMLESVRLVGAVIDNTGDGSMVKLQLPSAHKLPLKPCYRKIDFSKYEIIDPDDFFIPPINREATELEKVYVLNKMFSKSQYKKIYSELEKSNGDYLHPYMQSIIENKSLSLQFTVLSAYASELIKFIHVPCSQIIRKDFEICELSKTLNDIILERFSEFSEYKHSATTTGMYRTCTPDMKGRMVCHVIVCVLILNNFQCKLDPLADAVKHTKIRNIQELIRFVGASIVDTVNGKIVQLKLPLVPKTQVTRRKQSTKIKKTASTEKRRKKWWSVAIAL